MDAQTKTILVFSEDLNKVPKQPLDKGELKYHVSHDEFRMINIVLTRSEKVIKLIFVIVLIKLFDPSAKCSPAVVAGGCELSPFWELVNKSLF